MPAREDGRGLEGRDVGLGTTGEGRPRSVLAEGERNRAGEDDLERIGVRPLSRLRASGDRFAA